jgi:hypothetical protein
MSHNDDEKQASVAKLRASGVLPGQIYKHFKGGVYKIVAVGLNEVDLEPLVHYRDTADEYGIVWTRYLHMFTGRALDGEIFVTRFVQIS